MTYCLGLGLDAGLVFLADSRTNAGVDNISTYRKLFAWSAQGGQREPRALAVMTSGNLSVTQEVIALAEEEIAANGPDQDGGLVTILSAPSMFRVAERLGGLMQDVQARRGPSLAAAGVSSEASLIVGGQIGAAEPALYMIYSAGNFIQATADTPYFQIGEFKYGKPILDRAAKPGVPLADGVRIAALSMAATLRSNLSVGMPLDLAVLPVGAHVWSMRRIEAEDAAFAAIASGWDAYLRNGLSTLPTLAY